jgi:hypothetical protein
MSCTYEVSNLCNTYVYPFVFQYCRYCGRKYSSSCASKNIAKLCGDFFGVYLPVTSLRAINSTAVSLSASAGLLNSEQKMDFDSFAQGHSGVMARQLYTHMKEDDRAKGIQVISDQMNQQYKRKKTEDVDEGDVQNYESDTNATPINKTENLHMSPKKRMKSVDVENMDDWGLDHIDYNVMSRKIKWSDFEKQYISTFIESNSHMYDKWDQCLQRIWQSKGEVRRQFHLKHIDKSSRLRDAIRIRK